MKTYPLFILLCLIVNVSCIKEPDPIMLNKTNVNVNVTFKAQLSGTKAMSKALPEEQESVVEDIEILAFEQSGTDYLFSYQTSGAQITTVAEGIEFTADLIATENPQVFLIIANAKSSIDDIVIEENMNINDVLPLLVFAKEAEFATPTSGLFTPIPMYVKTAPTQITTSTTDIGTYNLIRMLARIDISSETSDFKLTRAEVYNRKNKGYIPYNDALWDALSEKAKAAYVPNAVGTNKTPSFIYSAENGVISHSIYTFEAKGVGDPSNATTIIVEGYHKPATNTTQLSYYRIDIPHFINGVAQIGSYGDILRNHLYQIKIASAKASGAINSDAAFNNTTRTLDVNITVWNQSKIDVNIDKPISIQIDKSYFKYDSTGTKTRQLTFITESPYTASTDDNWLTIIGEASEADIHTLTYTIDPLKSGGNRTGYINLRIGNLVKKVQIDQYADAAIKYTSDTYLLHEELEYDLEIASKAAWTMSDIYNPSGIIESIEDEPGEANESSVRRIKFKHIEDEFHASVSISSIDGEFDTYIIPINAVGAYDVGLDILLYPVDQTPSLSWYVYSNTPDGDLGTGTPPEDGAQKDPPRENSCACINSSDPANPWRLPTAQELRDIYAKVQVSNATDALTKINNNFDARRWYVSSETYITNKPWGPEYVYVIGYTRYGTTIPPFKPHEDYIMTKTGTKLYWKENTLHIMPGDESIGARCVRNK